MTTARPIALACLTAVLALVFGSAVPAAAQFATKLIVAVSDSPDPAASGGQVAYAVTVRAEGSTKAHNVVVTMAVPAPTVFVKCTVVRTEGAISTPCTPGLANGVVTASLGNIPAWKTLRVTLTLTMPTVVAAKEVTLTADADSTDATDDRNSATTTVLPPNIFVTYLPSGRIGPTGCGDTLSPERFGTDTTARLNQGLGCSTSEPYGLKITASGKTLDLNQFKIVGVTALGNVGILVSNATDVTVIGGWTSGDGSGIEFFDWCVKDEGKTARISIMNVRCFRARTAGIDIKSKTASITGVLVDRAVRGTATNTAGWPGGGVGIRTRGDQARIRDSIVRKTGSIGIWVAGIDSNGDGRVASIEGSNIASSTSKMRIENSAGIGLLLDRGPHFVKDLYVDGVYNDRDDPPVEGKNGVVVGLTGVNNLLDGVVVKQHGGHAFVVDGTGTTITNSNVDLVGLDGFVVTGAGSTLSGNGVQNARRGFIVTATGLDTDLDTNETEGLDGDGFVVDGDTPILTSNSAQGNGGRGFVIGGDLGLLDTNTAEKNVADGFIITGSNNAFKNNKAENNGSMGFEVSGSGNDFNTNSASNNEGLWEWMIGPGQTQVGGKTNKVNGKTFCIPAGGVNINLVIGTGPPCP